MSMTRWFISIFLDKTNFFRDIVTTNQKKKSKTKLDFVLTGNIT